jgi:protein-disulfide isomerase
MPSRFQFTLALAASCAAFVVACAQPGKPVASAVGGKLSCEEASLTLAESTIVGRFNGQPVTYKDLGPDVRRAEERALRSYCDAVYSSRSIALDNHVTENLVEVEAKKASMSADDWMRAEVDKRVPTPSDVEIQAFYDQQKGAMGDQLPPLDVVRPQVIAFLKREKSEAAVGEILDALKKSAQVEKSLPDVRSPPVDLAAAPHTGVKGRKGAKVQLVEFADFQCPYCTRAADTVKALQEKYGDKVEFQYRHFPLRQIHPQAQRASEIAQCAGEQGKFWDVHDALYANQQKLDEESAIGHAVAVGVDQAKLTECLSSGRAAAQVDSDFKKGEEAGVEGTPSFFLNGRKFEGNPTAAGLSQAIDEALRL